MTTQTEALKVLIHEMEYVLSCINADKVPFDGDDFHEALRLGKEALAQPEQDKERCVGCEACIDTACGRDECPKGWPKAAQPERHELQKDGKHPAPCARFCEANAFQIEIRRLKAQLAQPKEPEQEPMKNFEVCEIGARFDGAAQQHIPFVVIEFEPVPVNSEYDAKGWKDRDFFILDIKNTPPQRTWVGLSEEEVEACFHHVDEAGIGLFDFAEAIEAKLKEKNT